MNKLTRRYRESYYKYLFNMKDEAARGRLSMLASSVIVQAMLPLTSGVFYTGFLIANEIDIVNAGIITFIPYIASLAGAFSPYILERFEKRKTLLIISRLIYYTINILGVTLLPLVVTDATQKVLCFSVIIFISSVINALTVPGFTPWHLNFIPEKIRADYFSYSQIVRCTAYGIVILLSGIVSDALNGSQYEVTVLFALRILAYILAVIEVIYLMLPKEYPYIKKEKIRIRNVFVLSVRHRKFLRSIMIICSWVFFTACTAATTNYYLLSTAGVSYTYIGLMDASYAIFLFIFTGFFRKFLTTHSWMQTFAYTAFMYAPTMIIYSFVNGSNYLWLMTTVRILQHLAGVGLNIAYANLPYVNLPDSDRTNYIAFHSIAVNIATLAGLLFGTAFVAMMKDSAFTVFGSPYTAPQILMSIQGVGQLATAFAVVIFKNRLEPESAPTE